MGLKVKELRKVFPHGDGDVALFGGLSFELASGGSLALTGPSGSGKTTLLRLLELVGLDGKANHFPEQLSGGERQRVAVARALVMCPALVLADEPTGQLDAGRATVLLELLRELNQEQHVTIVMATHSLRARGYMREQIELG